MTDELSVTIIATGFSENPVPEIKIEPRKQAEKEEPKLELIIENQAEVEEKAAKKLEEKRKREEMMRKRSEMEKEEQQYHEKNNPIAEVEEEEQLETEEEENNGSIDGWFKKSFSNIFDNKDTPM
jgi:cell division protein FtsZ